MMQGIRRCYSPFYRDFSETPELAKFRRYLQYWSWILYNENSDIEKQINECNDIIAEVHGISRVDSLFQITDYHRAYVQDEHPFLKAKVEALENSIRRYGKDLTTAHAVANLPYQSDIYAEHFADYPNIFEDGCFGPTKEDAGIYKQAPSHADMCSLRGFDEQDPSTGFVLRHLKSINIRLGRMIRRVLRKQAAEQGTAPQQSVELQTVQTIINVLAGIYVPVLFAGCLAVLSCIKSEKARIVVLGVFGLMLTTSLILCVPTLKRSDLFAITAAFFAVGGVYIGAKSVDKW